MFIIIRSLIKKNHLKDAAKIYKELPPLPATIKKRGPYFNPASTGDVQVITFYSVENAGELNKAKTVLEERYAAFAGVPEFRYGVERWLEMPEMLECLKPKKEKKA